MSTVHRRERLKNHLLSKLDDESEIYTKSKFIANEIDLSPTQIGIYLKKLMDHDPDLDIEIWSGSDSPATWRIQLA